VPPAAAGDGQRVRGRAARQLEGADLAHDVGEAQRVVDEAPAPEDPREPVAHEQLVAEHLLPQRLHLGRLREEAMAAEVEAIAVAHDGARQPADLRVGLEDHDGALVVREHVACRQPSRPAAEHGEGFSPVSSHSGQL
jgi:hypothetical protein